MDVNKIIILYINLLNYHEHEVDDEEDEDEDEEEPHFLHPLDFSSQALQSKVLLLEEQEHGLEVGHEDDEQDQPDDVVQE